MAPPYPSPPPPASPELVGPPCPPRASSLVKMRSRKVPAPLSARLVTVSGVENACGATAAAANIIVRNAQALEYLNVVSICLNASGRDDFHVVPIYFRSNFGTTWKSSLPAMV